MKLIKASSSVVLTLFCALLISGLLNLRATPRGGGGAPVAARNGDVNCDGRLDISDGIYTLVHLFQDGPAPCAIAQENPCCEGIEQRLEEIRQSIDALGNDPCRNGSLRLMDNGDGTVTDECAGLMWQRKNLEADVDLNGSLDGFFNLNQARVLAGQSAVGGHRDWRLPTYEELEAWVMRISEKPYRLRAIPPLEMNFGEQGTYYWTSTPTGEGAFAANLNPEQLELRSQSLSMASRAWLVRSK